MSPIVTANARAAGQPMPLRDNAGMHLLIPFAFSEDVACRAALATLQLPHLAELLKRMTPVGNLEGEASSWSPPHERVLAQAAGLGGADGHIPWAAWQASKAAPAPGAWAYISPASWQVASNHITMTHPDDLQLDAEQATTLINSMRPFFEEDGITLAMDTPTRWLASGEVFRGLASASLDRVAGRNIEAWMPKAAQAATLRRLQSEMQMLLYTHPLSDQRQQAGLPPVNSFWVSGAGELPANWQAKPDPAPLAPRRLAQAALQGDWQAWHQAWLDTDARECRQLLQLLDQGQPATLTLSGERHARTWQQRPRSWRQRVGGGWRQPSVASHLESL
jgi:hypothetical protein